MIAVQDVLREAPHFETFCSVDRLHGLVETLRTDSRFEVNIAGTSANGLPIHHVCFGTGSVKAMLVGFPHSMEPIGGLTVFSLLTLLHQGQQSLLAADVEWHIVPCMDPDGALLNEGWTQQPFTLEKYVRNFYLQAPRDQVDVAFPITHKKLIFNEPSHLAKILQGLLDQPRPDFYFSLHNAFFGGAFYFLNRDIDPKFYREIYALLEQQRVPMQKNVMFAEYCTQFVGGIVEMATTRGYYDHVERTTSSPEKLVSFGASSWEYLSQIKPEALTFVAETGYVLHPDDGSDKETGQHLRRFKLRLEADSKFLATVILDEWKKVKADLDQTHPIYRAIVADWVFPSKEKLHEGGVPLSLFPTQDVLFNPQYDRTMTKGDRFKACMVDGGFAFLRLSYQFVRLLNESRQTPGVRKAIVRLEMAFDEALESIRQYVDFRAFKVIDCDTLAKVQLGSGLIVLNSILGSDGKAARAA